MGLRATYTTTRKRSALALAICVGGLAFVGGTVTIGEMYIVGNTPFFANAGLWITIALGVYTIWLTTFSIVFLALAGIPWILLDRLGVRSWWAATGAGFIVLFSVMYWMRWSSGADYFPNGSHVTILHARPTDHSQADDWKLSLITGLFGAGFGWLLWRIAYRRVRLSDHPGEAN
jgi:hypothetical protein